MRRAGATTLKLSADAAATAEQIESRLATDRLLADTDWIADAEARMKRNLAPQSASRRRRGWGMRLFNIVSPELPLKSANDVVKADVVTSVAVLTLPALILMLYVFINSDGFQEPSKLIADKHTKYDPVLSLILLAGLCSLCIARLVVIIANRHRYLWNHDGELYFKGNFVSRLDAIDIKSIQAVNSTIAYVSLQKHDSSILKILTVFCMEEPHEVAEKLKSWVFCSAYDHHT